MEGNPCNMHLLQLAEKVKEGLGAVGLVEMRFNKVQTLQDPMWRRIAILTVLKVISGRRPPGVNAPRPPLFGLDAPATLSTKAAEGLLPFTHCSACNDLRIESDLHFGTESSFIRHLNGTDILGILIGPLGGVVANV